MIRQAWCPCATNAPPTPTAASFSSRLVPAVGLMVFSLCHFCPILCHLCRSSPSIYQCVYRYHERNKRPKLGLLFLYTFLSRSSGDCHYSDFIYFLPIHAMFFHWFWWNRIRSNLNCIFHKMINGSGTSFSRHESLTSWALFQGRTSSLLKWWRAWMSWRKWTSFL